MANASISSRFKENDFRVGGVINRTVSVYSRNFLIFFVIAAAASVPSALLIPAGDFTASTAAQSPILLVVGGVLALLLSTISQAIIVHAAFQTMRGRAANLGDSLKVGLGRFVPIILMAILLGLLVGLGFILLVVPGVILFTMWYVAAPACVVERKGPWASMKRSAELTKGHRWKVFGLLLLMMVIGIVGSSMVSLLSALIGGSILNFITTVLWGGFWGAAAAIAVVVAYHDLRVAKEGVDIEQISAVFD
jgi:MFS family permease